MTRVLYTVEGGVGRGGSRSARSDGLTRPSLPGQGTRAFYLLAGVDRDTGRGRPRSIYRGLTK